MHGSVGVVSRLVAENGEGSGENMKRKLILVPLVLLIVLSFAPLVYAVETLSYNYGTQTGNWLGQTAVTSGVAYAITGNGQYLTHVGIQIKWNTGAITGAFKGGLFTSLTGNGTNIENSTDSIDAAGITAAYQWFNVSFTGNTTLQNGVTYYIGIWVTTGLSAQPNYGSNAGNQWYKSSISDAWAAGAGVGWSMKIYTSTESGYPTPAPTGSPGPLPTGGSYDTSDTNALINTFAGYMIPLLLWLIPALIMGYVTHWAKWPILIGLAIGGGLCYLFLGSQYVWMVFVTVIGLVGMAYQSSRGGGGTH